MSAFSAVLACLAGLLIGFLFTTVFFLRRQVESLKTRMATLEAAGEHFEARLFCIEQEQRWQASRQNEQGENVSG